MRRVDLNKLLGSACECAVDRLRVEGHQEPWLGDFDFRRIIQEPSAEGQAAVASRELCTDLSAGKHKPGTVGWREATSPSTLDRRPLALYLPRSGWTVTRSS